MEYGGGNERQISYHLGIPGWNRGEKLDYITTNAKYTNAERTEQSNTYWRANMNHNQQRRVQKMQLYNNAAKQ